MTKRLPAHIVALLWSCAAPAEPPGNACAVWDVSQAAVGPVDNALDLLFVIDDSESMAPAQEELARSLPRMLDHLLSGERASGFGAQPFRDLHIGVVSTDMGTGSTSVEGCSASGDDGVLSTRGNTTRAGCEATYPDFFQFAPADVDSASLAADLSCVVVMGTDGCDYEQPLEAMLKAVSPAGAVDQGGGPLLFAEGSVGHGDGRNAGFHRPDAILAVVLLTDEDDCSTRDPDLFDAASVRYPEPNLSLRCARSPDALHPVLRYAATFGDAWSLPDLPVFAAITGLPPDLAEEDNYARILRDRRMFATPDPSRDGDLAPSCVSEDLLGFPPLRIVALAEVLQSQRVDTVLASICEANFDATVDRIPDAIDERGLCIRNPQARIDGLVDCSIRETLPLTEEARGPSRCRDLADENRLLVDHTADEREVCLIGQVTGADDGPGWYYDDTPSPRCTQRIVFTLGAEPRGSTFRFECRQLATVTDPTERFALPCLDDPNLCSDANDRYLLSVFPRGLACEQYTNSCQPVCESTTECPPGWACYDADDDGLAFCTNPRPCPP